MKEVECVSARRSPREKLFCASQTRQKSTYTDSEEYEKLFARIWNKRPLLCGFHFRAAIRHGRLGAARAAALNCSLPSQETDKREKGLLPLDTLRHILRMQLAFLSCVPGNGGGDSKRNRRGREVEWSSREYCSAEATDAFALPKRRCLLCDDLCSPITINAINKIAQEKAECILKWLYDGEVFQLPFSPNCTFPAAAYLVLRMHLQLREGPNGVNAFSQR